MGELINENKKKNASYANSHEGELVSIIVPVYNISEYVDRCISSIVSQSYKNMEIIIIDDGSIDGSGDICDKWARQDGRIRIIHKENEGLSVARNLGIDLSNGKYIAFVDGDDWISKRYVDEMLLMLHKHNADIAICATIEIFNDRDFSNRVVNTKEDVLSGEGCLQRILYQKGTDVQAWGKLYTRDVIGTHRFPPGKWYEDWLFTPMVVSDAQMVVMHGRAEYYYLQRHGSISNKTFELKNMDAYENALLLERYIKSHHPHLKNAAVSRLFSILCTIIMKIPKNEYGNQRNVLWNAMRSIRMIVLVDPKSGMRNKGAACLTIFGYSFFSFWYKRLRKRAKLNY